ncbi:hypothetical protein DCAR_0727471 [Daucus carota subsp. sativus]|uniref:Cytochrome b5 heme-binding domain-containing protein n=1 Tax=Daucus carota subsp. sativus TaxID=79200 RepID=A0AAF0XHR5_DAUCS|nr:PREDICTED: cytochrome b5 domain-containing protein RLF-like [Daucus carota subsp. sativus]WOH08035.1 hypothetical protein DCAR_0727471 [Daucus carota subsp. sativus]
MDDNDDFTFCKVPGPVNVEVFEAHKTVPDVGNIDLNDEPRKGSQTDDTSGAISKNDSIAAKVSKDVGSSPSASQEPQTVVKKPAPRAKVPFEKGYSQMDWLKLTQTHPDLAGLKGQSNKRLITLKEVKLHKTEEDSMWTVLNGRVYNITPYMKFHPGGVDFLMKAVGKDCTALFKKYHAWVNADFLLEKCLVGVLDDSP